MRILFLVSSMEGGGAERVAALLSNEWVAQGHSVILLATFSGRGGCSYTLDERVELAYLADRTRSCFDRTAIGRLFALRRAIQDSQCDVVLSFLTNVNVAAILARSGLRVPLVVSERIYPPLMPTGRLWSALRQLTYRHADVIVMQTKEGRRWVDETIPGAESAVIANPLKLPLVESEPVVSPDRFVPKDCRLLLSVGRLDPQKNFPLLLNAFAEIAPRFPEWRLVIVGEGPERAALELLVGEKDLTGKASLVGRAGNLDEWYRRASAFAFTSRFEGFPNALLEALGYGLPVLSLDCPTGPAELVEDGRNGLLLPLSSTGSTVASGLTRLLSVPWPTSDNVLQAFAASAISEQWITLFEKIIKTTKRSEL